MACPGLYGDFFTLFTFHSFSINHDKKTWKIYGSKQFWEDYLRDFVTRSLYQQLKLSNNRMGGTLERVRKLICV